MKRSVRLREIAIGGMIAAYLTFSLAGHLIHDLSHRLGFHAETFSGAHETSGCCCAGHSHAVVESTRGGLSFRECRDVVSIDGATDQNQPSRCHDAGCQVWQTLTQSKIQWNSFAILRVLPAVESTVSIDAFKGQVADIAWASPRAPPLMF
ncbi:MAG TPA: hypothetical protein PKD54_07195 [Pirellulaceae bacterium]|nr:hypothetical protein [Pirellulaceae bacterium]